MKKLKLHFSFFCFLFIGISLLLVSCKKQEEKAENEEVKEEKREEVRIEVPPVSIDGVLYGVVLAKEQNSLILQSDLGKTVRLPLEEKTDLSEVGEGLVTGAALRVEYSGGFSKKKRKKLKIEKILPSDKLPKISKEALELCANIILSFEKRNLEELSSLCDYPLIMIGKEKLKIGDEKEFRALEKEEIFDKELLRGISSTNLFLLEEYPQGFILGKSTPNLMVSNTKNGWKVVTFRYQ